MLPKGIVVSMKNKKENWLFKEVPATIRREAEFYYFFLNPCKYIPRVKLKGIC